MALMPQYDVGRLMIQSRLLWMQSGLLWASRRVPGALRHYNQIGVSILVAAGLSALGAAQSTADTTYTYTGNHFTMAVSPYTTNEFISGFFTLPTPFALGPNIPFISVEPSSYSFSDGVHTYQPSTAPPGTTLRFDIQTDATGTPSHWDIFVRADVPAPAFRTVNGSIAGFPPIFTPSPVSDIAGLSDIFTFLPPATRVQFRLPRHLVRHHHRSRPRPSHRVRSHRLYFGRRWFACLVACSPQNRQEPLKARSNERERYRF
jgi:hypothetical protein